MRRGPDWPSRLRGASRVTRRVACGAALLGSAGCFATIDGEASVEAEVPTVEVHAVPVEVHTYPRYVYRGETVYLIDGRWYARRGPRWVMYREEPRELGRYRVEHYERRPARRVYR